MKGNEQVISVLNQVRARSLPESTSTSSMPRCVRTGATSVFTRLSGTNRLAKMKHADQIIERILFLEGTPNVSAYDKIMVGSMIKQQLENDRDLELAALTVLHPGIKTCVEAGDDSTRELLEHIVVDEEKHVDWIEAQLHQINEVGYQNYLAQQIHKKD